MSLTSFHISPADWILQALMFHVGFTKGSFELHSSQEIAKPEAVG
jgi:hypothetical protein